MSDVIGQNRLCFQFATVIDLARRAQPRPPAQSEAPKLGALVSGLLILPTFVSGLQLAWPSEKSDSGRARQGERLRTQVRIALTNDIRHGWFNGECCKFVVEVKVAVDNRKFSWVAANRPRTEAVHQNCRSIRRALQRLAFADHMDRLVASERSPEEIRDETIALTGVLC
jgi:hypothetical protein